MMKTETITAEALYLQFHDKVTAYVTGKVEHRQDAEDLVSEIFTKAYAKWDSYDPAKASLSTWIYTITHNTVVDYYRSQRKMVEYADYMDAEEFAAEEPDERLEKLADALQRLKEKERDLIILHYYKGYTLKKVAELMGMSYINAKVIHKKALTALRNFFSMEDIYL